MDDKDLMVRVSRGDRCAFETLVRRHERRVVNYMYRLVGNAHDAEDLAQEVFLRVYRARERYEPRAQFTTWVYRIGHNLAANYHRSESVRRGVTALPGEVAAAPGADPIVRDEQIVIVKAALDALPENQRSALVLTRFEGRSYDEAAEIMDTTKAAVRSLISRAKDALRGTLGRRLGIQTGGGAQ